MVVDDTREFHRDRLGIEHMYPEWILDNVSPNSLLLTIEGSGKGTSRIWTAITWTNPAGNAWHADQG
jgi:hypothetical protein